MLNDENGQILFEPSDEDFTNDGILEIQIIHDTDHSGVMHEIIDELSLLGLDVKQGMIHQSRQLGHHHAPHAEKSEKSERSERSRRNSHSNAVEPRVTQPEASVPDVEKTPAAEVTGEAEAETSTKAAKKPAELKVTIEDVQVKTRKTSLPRRLSTTGRSFTTALANVGRRKDAEAGESHEEIGSAREVFFVRETDGSHLTSAKRRHEIQHKLQQILINHKLRGEVLVRLVHEREAGLLDGAVSNPKLRNREITTIVKCVGQHHKELTHLICDAIEEGNYDIVHADIVPGEKGFETNTFYIQHPHGESNLTDAERTTIQSTLEALYREHTSSPDRCSVSVYRADAESPNPSPLDKRPFPGFKKGRNSKENMGTSGSPTRSKARSSKELMGTSASPTRSKARISKELMGMSDQEKAAQEATSAFMGERKQRRASKEEVVQEEAVKEEAATNSASTSIAATSSTIGAAV